MDDDTERHSEADQRRVDPVLFLQVSTFVLNAAAEDAEVKASRNVGRLFLIRTEGFTF